MRLFVLLLIASSMFGSGREQPSVLRPPVNQEFQVRTIVAQPGRPLIADLKPTDHILDVEDLSIPGSTSGPPGGMSRIEAWTKFGTFVGLVEIAEMAGRFNTGGDRIESVVTAEVIEALKDSRASSTARTPQLQFVVSGGEVTVGRQIIRMGRPGYRSPIVGQQYLVFADRRGDELTVTARTILSVDDNDNVLPLVSGVAARSDIPSTYAAIKKGILTALSKTPM